MNLDSRQEIKKLDKANVLGSVESLGLQCIDAWEKASGINVPADYSEFDLVIMTGMGGSGLGARVIESAFAKDLRKPLVRVNDYGLPLFANENSLVICSSYSGTTEETLSSAKAAISRKAKWMVISTGGDLIELAKKSNVPFYQINPTYNPSNQPRMAIGYSIVGQLVLASKAGLINLNRTDIDNVKSVLDKVFPLYSVEVKEGVNLAKKLARKLVNKTVAFVSAEHLTGATHVMNNQLNENSKVFSSDFLVPELNHHLMEGLKHPVQNKKSLFFVFVTSDLYSKKITKRMQITREVVEKNGIGVFDFHVESDTNLSQSFELIQFGSFVGLYLALLYGQDPSPIPWVDYFKEKLNHNE